MTLLMQRDKKRNECYWTPVIKHAANAQISQIANSTSDTVLLLTSPAGIIAAL